MIFVFMNRENPEENRGQEAVKKYFFS